MDFQVKVKSEPDEIYDDGVVIDGSYPDFEQVRSLYKLFIF